MDKAETIGGVPAFKPGGRRWFFRMFGWRLRFYAIGTCKLLLRRWQIWCFLLFVISPGAMSFASQMQVLSKPVDYLLFGEQAAAVWLSWLLLAIAWTSLQAGSLSGGAAWRYLRCQPSVAPLEKRLDLCLLLIVDLPLFLPFAAFPLGKSVGIGSYLLTVALAAQLPIIQQLLLRGAPLAALSVSGFSLLAVWLQSLDVYAPIIAGLLLIGPLGAERLRSFRLPCRKVKSNIMSSRLSPGRPALVNLAKIEFLVLTRFAALKSRLPLLAYTAAIVWFGNHWRNLGFRPPVADGLLLGSMIPLLWQSAGWEWELRMARKPLLPLLASLGINRRQWLLADCLVLETLFSLLLALPIAMLAQDIGLRALVLWPLGVIALALLVAHYANAQADRPRIVPKLIVALGFMASGWLLVISE